jgi:hypothetical protein
LKIDPIIAPETDSAGGDASGEMRTAILAKMTVSWHWLNITGRQERENPVQTFMWKVTVAFIYWA